MNLSAPADSSYVEQGMKMWQLISKKCCPVFPFLMNQSGNSVMELWSNNKVCTECRETTLERLLNKQCKAIAFYITLICKLAVAFFLGHYSEEGKKLSKLFPTILPAGARDCILAFTLTAILNLLVFNGTDHQNHSEAKLTCYLPKKHGVWLTWHK